MGRSAGGSPPIETAPPSMEAKKDLEFPEETKAREILDLHFGDYIAIREAFKNEKILPKNIDWIQNDLRKKIPEASFLQESDYEMLFVLRLFHPETYEHSVRTYATGREKIMSDHPVGAYLRKKIGEEIPEGNALEIVYRSLLLHDMGKIAVPVFILDDTHTDTQWERLGEERCGNHDMPSCYKKRHEDTGLRYKDIVPVGFGLTPKQNEDLNRFGSNLPEGYEEYAYTSDAPLGRILEIHPAVSAAILESAGKHIEAQIVREHHASEASPEQKKYPTASGALFFSKSMASVIHAADFMDALLSPRSYKGARGIFLTLGELSKEVKNKTLPKELADLWIDADIDQFRNEMNAVFEQAPLTPEEREAIGGPFNYYISKLPEKQQSEEREHMEKILDQFRPRHHESNQGFSEGRRKNEK